MANAVALQLRPQPIRVVRLSPSSISSSAAWNWSNTSPLLRNQTNISYSLSPSSSLLTFKLTHKSKPPLRVKCYNDANNTDSTAAYVPYPGNGIFQFPVVTVGKKKVAWHKTWVGASVKRLLWLTAGLFALARFTWWVCGPAYVRVPYKEFVESMVDDQLHSLVILNPNHSRFHYERKLLVPDPPPQPPSPSPLHTLYDACFRTALRPTIYVASRGLFQDYPPYHLLNRNRVHVKYGLSYFTACCMSITLLPLLSMIFLAFSKPRTYKRVIRELGFKSSSTNVSFSDIDGLEEAKEQIREIVDFTENPNRQAEDMAMRPQGVLLVGPPGAGKTLLAKAVAGEAKLPFISFSASELALQGESGVLQVQDYFVQALLDAPSLIFIDQIDALAKRLESQITAVNNEKREQILTQILAEMDSIESNSQVIILGATNSADVLDPALLRQDRFSRVVLLNMPDQGSQEAIMKTHVSKTKLFLSSDVDLKEEAAITTCFTGEGLEKLANDAASNATHANRKMVSKEDCTKVIEQSTVESKRNADGEAEHKCASTVANMDKKLRAACNAPNAKLEQVLQVLESLISEYDASSFGPGKWEKIATFLEQSLEGPIVDLFDKLVDQSRSERATLQMNCQALEDKLSLMDKKLEFSKKQGNEYLKRYEDAIADKKRISDEYSARITNLQSEYRLLDEKYDNLSEELGRAKKQASDLRVKTQHSSTNQKIDKDKLETEISNWKIRCSSAEARLNAAREKVDSAKEEALEWKRKHDLAVEEAQISSDRATELCDQANKQAQIREDSLRSEFSTIIAQKEREVKEYATKLENTEQKCAGFDSQLKAQESKAKSQDLELSSLEVEMKELMERLENTKNMAQSTEKEYKILQQEKTHLEQRFSAEFKRFGEADERCKAAEKEAKRALDIAEIARDEAALAQQQKSEIQALVMEKSNTIERLERHLDSLEQEKRDLLEDLESTKKSKQEALSKVKSLEPRVDEREQEMERLLHSEHEQNSSRIQGLESLLASERAAKAEASNKVESLSLELQNTQAKLDNLQQELTSVCLNETALDKKLKTKSRCKRQRSEDYVGMESMQDKGIDMVSTRQKRRFAGNENSSQPIHEANSVFKPDAEKNSSDTKVSQDYRKFTIERLKQELKEHGAGDKVLQLRTPRKKELVALYEKHVMKS